MSKKMLEIQNLCKSFPKKDILENLSLNANSSEIVAVVGENGSGKTTLFNIICGFLRPSRGTVQIQNKVKVIGLLEYPNFFPYMSGLQNLQVLPQGDKTKEKNLITTFGLQNDINKKVSKYSLGMKQKLALIYIISQNSEIIILDEPTNSLDAQSIEILRKILIEEKNNGKLILISSHNLYFIDGFADRIFLLKNKKLSIIDSNQKECYVFKLGRIEEALLKLKEMNINCRIDNDDLFVYTNLTLIEILNILNPYDVKNFSKSKPLNYLYLEALHEAGN